MVHAFKETSDKWMVFFHMPLKYRESEAKLPFKFSVVALSSAVTVIFLTTSILLAVGVVIFLSGLVLHRGACMPLK